MPIEVVDASALVALLFGEPNGDRIGARLDGEGLAAPPLLPFEVGNACLTKMRRYQDRRDALLAAFSLMARMEIEIVDVDHEAALALAEQTRLIVYDASYLWLARKLGAELVTLDKRLDAAQAAARGR